MVERRKVYVRINRDLLRLVDHWAVDNDMSRDHAFEVLLAAALMKPT